MTLTVYHIPNANTFIKLIRNCCGDVTLHLPDHTTCNLKEDRVAQQLIKLTFPKKEGITLSFSNCSDVPMLIKYMTEAACHG